MDDQYDQRISGEQFVVQAVSTRAYLDPAVVEDPDFAMAVHSLEDFVNAARSVRCTAIGARGSATAAWLAGIWALPDILSAGLAGKLGDRH